MIDTLIYWLYISLVLSIAFIPGFAIATFLKKLDIAEKLAISFGFSFLIIVLLTPLFALKLDTLARFIFVLITIASLFYISKQKLKDKHLKFSQDFIFLALVLIISLVLRFFVQTIWDYPVMGGDWFMHGFKIPYQFELGNWVPPRDRPPFFNLLIYNQHQLFGTSLYQYWITQIVSVVANSVLIIPAYLIGKKIFSDKVVKISTAFMIICPYIVQHGIYTWPKNLAAYFILLMVYFLFFRNGESADIKRDYALAGFFAGFGYLIHNYTAVYIGTAILAWIYKTYKHENRKFWNILYESKLAYFFLPMIVVVAPYLCWMYFSYGTLSAAHGADFRSTSSFIYYPFAVKSLCLYNSPEEVFATFFATPIHQIIWIRICNVIVTLLPVAIPLNPLIYQFPSYDPVMYYNGSYPGFLSFGMYILVAIWFIRYLLKKTKSNTYIVILIIIPFIFHIFLWGWLDWGLHFMSFPTNPFLIMLGFNELYKTKIKQKTSLYITYLIFIGCLIEDIIYGWLTLRFRIMIGGLEELNGWVQKNVPNVQIYDVISAHFLLDTNVEFLSNLIISMLLIIFSVLLYFKIKGDQNDK